MRLVYTIDEFPFRGREVAEPTAAETARRDLRWLDLAACRDAKRARGSPPAGP